MITTTQAAPKGRGPEPWANPLPEMTIHERINRVLFTAEQRDRVIRGEPLGLNGIPERTTSGYELAAWRMPNGSRGVVLSDDSETTWQAYCAELVARSAPPAVGSARWNREHATAV